MGKDSALFQQIKNQNIQNTTPLILESTFEGVHLTPLDQFNPVEALVVLRLELPKNQLRPGLELLANQIGKSYDFDFDLEDNSSLYCSELLYPSFIERGITPKAEEGILRSVISPNALLHSLFDTTVPDHVVHFLFYVESDGNQRIFRDKEKLQEELLNSLQKGVSFLSFLERKISFDFSHFPIKSFQNLFLSFF